MSQEPTLFTDLESAPHTLPCSQHFPTQVGLVSQEPTLFATTIFENIAMGRNGATAEEVKAAAEAANAHRFIANLPHQYDTQVRRLHKPGRW